MGNCVQTKQKKNYTMQQVVCILCNMQNPTFQLSCTHHIHPQCLKNSLDSLKQQKKFDCSICLKTISSIQIDKLFKQKKQSVSRSEINELKFQCGICENILDPNKEFIIFLNCDRHNYCHTCFEAYINQQINQNKYQIGDLKCPQCQVEINQQIINQLISHQLHAKIFSKRNKNLKIIDPNIKIIQCKGFLQKNSQTPLLNRSDFQTDQAYSNKLQSINMLIKMGKKPTNIPQIQQCYCKLSYHMIEELDIKVLTCPICQTQNCPNGCNSIHKNRTCQQYNIQQKNMDSNLRTIIYQFNMAQCFNPKCGYPIQRVSGCNWVKCKCGWQICYQCKLTWKATDIHFSLGHPAFNQQQFLKNQK